MQFFTATGTSTANVAPIGGPSTAGAWDDFLNTVIRGTTTIISAVKNPAGVQGGSPGTAVPLPAANPTDFGNQWLGLAVVVLVLYVVTR